MTGPSLTTEAFILQKAPPKEAFAPAVAFSAEHGTLRILQRVPRKPTPNHLPLDLFDHVALLLDGGTGGTWFVKEVRLLHRFTGIGQNYRRLQHASQFTALIARNPVHEDSRDAVTQLLGTALQAFATSDRPDLVGFKSLYVFARDEGYPLKQHWFPTLPADDRADVALVLKTPVEALTVNPERVAHLHRQLEDYLRGHTDVMVE